jgi:dephospho-CoA kinase
MAAYQSTQAIGFSGALGAGKTTAARLLEQEHRFAYGRYSEIIEERVKHKKSKFDRFDLQVEGQRVYDKYSQRWLGQQLLTKFNSNTRVTIDGLRFLDDHAYLTEVFGSRFLHIHLIAPKHVREKRSIKRHGREFNFEKADSHEVEQKIGSLKDVAKHVVENTGSVEMLHKKLTALCKM